MASAACDAREHRRAVRPSTAQGGGGTDFLPALKRALPARGTTRPLDRTATDGYVSVESEALLIRESHAANLFAFGIGSPSTAT